MGKTKLEMMVGFFVLLALVIFFVIVFFVSGVYFLREGFHVKAVFDYTAGLDKGAPVRLAGVRVGEVNAMSIEYDRLTQKPAAVIDLWLEKGTNIREDSKIYIFGTFALSESHIEIVSDGEPEGRLLQDGDTIRGVSPVPMEKLTEQGLAIAEKVDEMTTKLNRILGDEALQDAMQGMLLDMSELLKYMNRIIVEKDQNIDVLIANVEVSVEKMRSILETIDQGEGTVGQLVKNDELYQEMKDFIREIKLHPWRLLKKDSASETGRKKFLGIF